MAAGDLTTIEKIRNHAGLADTVSDAVLEEIITSSSTWFKGEIGADILQANYTDTFDGNGLFGHPLANRPAISVTSVTVDGAVIPARPAVSSSNTDPEGHYLDGDRVEMRGYTFSRGYRNCVIVYSAGYVAIPADLDLAVKKHVVLEYRRRGKEGQSSSSMPGESLTFGDSGDWKYILDTIERYRLRMVRA